MTFSLIVFISAPHDEAVPVLSNRPAAIANKVCLPAGDDLSSYLFNFGRLTWSKMGENGHG